MIGLFSLALALSLQSAAVGDEADDVEIERQIEAMKTSLKSWHARIQDTGALDSCTTIASSGDQEVDAVGCQAMSECAVKMEPITAQLRAPSLSDSKRQKMAREAGDLMFSCLTSRRLELLRNLAESRVRMGREQ